MAKQERAERERTPRPQREIEATIAEIEPISDDLMPRLYTVLADFDLARMFNKRAFFAAEPSPGNLYA